MIEVKKKGLRVAQSTNAPAVETENAAAPRLWHKPELRRLLAGEAEAAGHSGQDGSTNLS
jgi:hypothetical protein